MNIKLESCSINTNKPQQSAEIVIQKDEQCERAGNV